MSVSSSGVVDEVLRSAFGMVGGAVGGGGGGRRVNALAVRSGRPDKCGIGAMGVAILGLSSDASGKRMCAE